MNSYSLSFILIHFSKISRYMPIIELNFSLGHNMFFKKIEFIRTAS